jgi:sulfur-carrier protein
VTTVHVQYYAILREQARTSRETVTTEAASAAALYAELTARHGFSLAESLMKVAINGEFAAWSSALKDGDEVVYIPPVAGG